MTPNVIHFVHAAWANTRPLSFLNYICVKRAIEKQKPDKVKFWIDKDPEPNIWWHKIRDLVTVERRPMTGNYGGTEIVWPQLQSDVTRLEILQEEGGIYLDTDVILLNDLEWLRAMPYFVIAEEPNAMYGAASKSLCNAVMMTEAGNPFISAWLQILPEALKSNVWAQGGVVKPHEIAKGMADHVSVIDYRYLCPFDLHYPYIFEPRLNRPAASMMRDADAIHIYETYWRDTIKSVTPEWCATTDCIFSRIVREMGEI